ncbi:uncharacterized protein BJ212DRAFT_1487357 [Suillus subaureus]|uniref:Uncharacterized protein n=1 Tax=Suillus subaureus TaxID=48587 RepID=A0A9P7DT14_9AGAM|nr:uncharacterized protein BJ212DRAFT_1487357 [Suillus subaureus]KAG1802471.1 hypothetical protein BJ212DRAFT_1487357 [Suillus subaureus]
MPIAPVVSVNLLNLVQTLIITSSLLVGYLIVGTLSPSCGAELSSANHHHADVIHTSSTSLRRTSAAYTVQSTKASSIPSNELTEIVDEPDAKELVGTEQAKARSCASSTASTNSNPAQGCILIDGRDIRTVTLSGLRRAIGVAP